ncbi:MAG: hypothetical protein FWD34_00565 [Oscillospiraceae bacterium]|nr:hypothetical protein [Oscillospiraceae bacterium]
MKKLILLILITAFLISLCSCNRDNIENDTVIENNFDYYRDDMPEPFIETQNGGGSLQRARFNVPTFNDLDGGGLDFIDFSYVTPFIDLNDFYSWVNSSEMNNYWSEPVTNLIEYPNMYSFIITFNIPVNDLKEIMEHYTNLALTVNVDHFTLEETNLILSLNEAKIMEYFVSDYSIYHNGRIFTPAWIYYHTLESYKSAGITPAMLEEKLPLYAEFNFTEEATAAFEQKLSEFTGNAVSLR